MNNKEQWLINFYCSQIIKQKTKITNLLKSKNKLINLWYGQVEKNEYVDYLKKDVKQMQKLIKEFENE